MPYINKFKTYLDLDFTAQSNQTVSADGAFTLGGMTWTKGNSANEATHLTITNGTGAVFKPTSTSDYNGTTRTLPYMWLPFNQIGGLEALNWQSRIRVWLNISADNIAANYDDSVLAIDNNSTTFTFTMKRGIGTNGNGFQSQCGVSPNNNFVGANFTLGTANRIQVLDIDFSRSSFTAFLGSNATLWPDPSALAMGAIQTTGNVSYAANGYSNPFSTMGVMIGVQRATSGTSLSITIANLRVDVLQY